MALAITSPGMPQRLHRARAERKSLRAPCAALTAPGPHGGVVRQHSHGRTCSIRIISVHLLGAAGELLRVLFLDRAGHISAQPHYLPREEALILASNQQRVLGSQARVLVL